MTGHIKTDIMKGILGVVTTGGTTAFSFVAEAEAGLRIISLLVGITVGVLTALSIYKSMNKKGKND